MATNTDPTPLHHPIICPHCNQDTGWSQESLMFLYLSDDLRCSKCGEIIVHIPKITWQ